MIIINGPVDAASGNSAESCDVGPLVRLSLWSDEV